MQYEHKGAIITVHRPELTDEERQRRMQAIHRATAQLLERGGQNVRVQS